MIAGLLFAVGALLEAVAPGVFVLTTGRLPTGFGVGFASIAAPLYAAEMAPAAVRGRFVSGYQLAITIGIFLAYLVNDALQDSGQWRLMFARRGVPGRAADPGIHDRARVGRGSWSRPAGATRPARWSNRSRAPDDAPQVLADIEESLAQEQQEGQANWDELLTPALRRPLIIGIGLSVIQQITGINAIIYYANDIFARAGFESAQAQSRATLFAIGLVNVLATFIAIAYVDRFGRKPLLKYGLIGMCVSLALVGIAFASLRQLGWGQSPPAACSR